MSEPEPSNVHPSTGAPLMRRVLSGELAARFGPLPVVSLPQDDEPLLGWIYDVADILRDKGLYQRGDVVVIPMPTRRRLEVMSAEVFCSWVQRHLMPSKIKYDRSGEAREVYKDVPSDVAEKTLLSLDFVPHMPRIDSVMPAPLPTLDAEGNLVLLPVGYHAPTRTYTFDLNTNDDL